MRTMRPRHIGGLLVLFLLGMTAMRLAASYVSLVSGGAEILDLNFGNEATYIHNTLFALGGSGRDAYLHVYLLIDACYAVIYAVFYACTMAFFLRRIAPERWEWKRIRWVILLPMMAAACDWWENISFACMILQFPTPASQLLVTSATIATMTKFILVYLSLLLVLGLAAGWIILRIRAGRRNQIKTPTG